MHSLNLAAVWNHRHPWRFCIANALTNRRVQKTPAGVLVVRRGLLFTRQRCRRRAYFQKSSQVRKLPYKVDNTVPFWQ